MLWDPFLYCINDSIQGNSETGNKVFVLPSKVAINNVAQTVKDIEPAFICMIRYEEAKYSRYNSDSISML